MMAPSRHRELARRRAKKMTCKLVSCRDTVPDAEMKFIEGGGFLDIAFIFSLSQY